MEEEKKKTLNIKRIAFWVFVAIFAVCLILLVSYGIREYKDRKAIEAQQEELLRQRNELREKAKEMAANDSSNAGVGVQNIMDCEYTEEELSGFVGSITTVLPEYREMLDINRHFIGWLTIDGTVIDYPVVQSPEDENMYLNKDFYGNENQNGTLIMDTDSVVGVGSKEYDYFGGEAPSSNLIIHGHTMKSGAMFGRLKDYHSAEYCKEHSIIKFDSLYEQREYEVIAAFESRVFYSDETDVFKYYNFFEANTEEEFDYWYSNIKSMSLYDTGVEAEFGDEFITLSCCAYHTTNGRFVVVGKRIK